MCTYLSANQFRTIMNKTVSIILPAYNEEPGVEKTILAIQKSNLEAMGYTVEVIVVDNNSTDNTAAVSQRLGAIVIHQSKQGYGHACRAGIAKSSGEIVVVADADGTYPLEQLPQLLKIFADERLVFLTTNRFGKNKHPQHMSWVRRIGNQLLSTVVRLSFALPLEDSQSGLWIVQRSSLECARLTAGGYAFSEEIKIEQLYYQRVKWREVPIDYLPRAGTSKLHPLRHGIEHCLFILHKKITSLMTN